MGPTARIRVSWLVLLLLAAGCAGKTTVTEEPAPAAPPPATAKDAPTPGLKARISVLRFDVQAATAPAAIGGGLADILGAALAQTNRFTITPRDADLVVVGVVTEFAPAGPGPPGQAAQVAIEIGLLDAKTSQVYASGTVRGRAGDTAGLAPGLQPPLGAALAAHAGSPLEKAIRSAIQSAVLLVSNGTPAAYYRHTDTAAVPPPAPAGPPPPGAGAPPPAPPRPAPPAPPRPAPAPAPGVAATPRAPAPVIGTRYVKVPTANLRDAAGTLGKILVVIRRGAKLDLLETKAGWHRVRLSDGKEGWIADSVTSATPP